MAAAPELERLDLSLATGAENLALDEALLEERDAVARADGDDAVPELLRFWESPQVFVCVGVAGRLAAEVDEERCRELGVPVLRRVTGGGTVVQGPGCMNFALLLSLERRPELRNFTHSYREILGRTGRCLEVAGCRHAGTSDLAVGEKKFSGNAQKRKRFTVLHHGSVLYGFDLGLVEELLPLPPAMPEYRAGRSHGDFLRNVPLTADEIRERIAAAWNAVRTRTGGVPATAGLVAEKYAQDAWNERF